MMAKPKVLVVMATYNGEKYIKTQIDSILAQKEVDVTIHVFDDLSKDKTQEIVKEYEKKHKNVILHINEKNKNYTYNFIDGLFTFKDEQGYDFYSFADQDDFWVEDKLISAINKIKEIGECTLYSSNLTIVDGELKPLNRFLRPEDFSFERHEQLHYCMVTGCTAVFDNAFKNLVTKHYPEGLIYHDYWVGLIANYAKDAHYYWDKDPSHILYRQHGNNASGGSVKYSLWFKIKSKFKGWFVGTKINFYILKLLIKYFSEELNDEDKQVIEKFINYKKWSNKKYLLKHLKCSNKKRFNTKILLNRYKEKKLEEM